MKKFITFLLSLSLISGILFSVAACGKTGGTDVDYILSKGELILGLDDSFPPFGYRNEKDEIVGFDIDLAEEITKRWKINIKLQPITWSQKEKELESKNIDVIWNGFSKTPEREANCALTIPYFKNEMILVVRKDSGINNIDDLNGKILTVQEKSSAEDALDKDEVLTNSLEEIVRLKNNILGFTDVTSGNSDALLLDSAVAKFHIKEDNDLMILPESLMSEVYVIGCRKEDTNLAEKLNKTLRDMAKDGTFAKLTEKWFGEDLSSVIE